MLVHYDIRITGIVQGVGFRPFIHNLAREYGLAGIVYNDTEGVFIGIEGEDGGVRAFLDSIKRKAPPLAYIRSIAAATGSLRGYRDFTIKPSGTTKERTAFYSPDVALCDECLAELFDPANRRYHYPFITCINCGPRFSIVTDIPYDRPNTTMAPFALCPACRREYEDFADRRFHAQPVACEECGPRLSLRDRNGTVLSVNTDDVTNLTLSHLRAGRIVAIKGVGGYHLAVDARSDAAVAALRERKRRPFKPFALMIGDLQYAEELYEVSRMERMLLVSRERPIVLLKIRTDLVSPAVAPEISYHGVMLPYTPFQFLLFSGDPELILVMTSGNISDEPIVYEDDSALRRLGAIADYFVTYDREITAQTDDSVMFVAAETPYFVRRSRGFVPLPFAARETPGTILAMGGDLKNTFAFARADHVIMSQYLGDMADAYTYEVFRRTVDHYIRIFDFKPGAIVTDLHPGYMTGAFGRELGDAGTTRIGVQHHHAHVASVLEDRGIDGPVIGIAYDGTGYGTDGTLWGSEFLIADRAGFERAAHFSYFPLPGGESAIRDVWKIGLSLLYAAYGEEPPVTLRSGADADLVAQMLRKKINTPPTCSIGRIFDGVAALLGLRQSVSAEAEAAILVEEAAMRGGEAGDAFCIPFETPARGDRDARSGRAPIVISTGALVRHLVGLLRDGVPAGTVALAFHRSIAATTAQVVGVLRGETGISTVALSGGVFHNRVLLRLLLQELGARGFEVFTPLKVPFNDECIALGQIAVARERLLRSSTGEGSQAGSAV